MQEQKRKKPDQAGLWGKSAERGGAPMQEEEEEEQEQDAIPWAHRRRWNRLPSPPPWTFVEQSPDSPGQYVTQRFEQLKTNGTLRHEIVRARVFPNRPRSAVVQCQNARGPRRQRRQREARGLEFGCL